MGIVGWGRFMNDDQFDKIAHIDFGTICRSLFVYLTWLYSLVGKSSFSELQSSFYYFPTFGPLDYSRGVVFKRPINLHPLSLFWKHGSQTLKKNHVQNMGCKKQGHCYSIREEARLPLLILNNNDPVFCTLLFAPYILDPILLKVPDPKQISGRPDKLCSGCRLTGRLHSTNSSVIKFLHKLNCVTEIHISEEPLVSDRPNRLLKHVLLSSLACYREGSK